MKKTLAAVIGALALPLLAQEVRKDPWVPPQVKRSEGYTETRGEALRAQVEARMRAQFDAADPARSGTLTREQARSAGLGYIADNFESIDTSRAGFVRFDDVMRFLRSRSRD